MCPRVADCTLPREAHSTHVHARTQAMKDLNWEPEFGLVDGLKDSYSKDFGRGTFRKAANFATDDVSAAA